MISVKIDMDVIAKMFEFPLSGLPSFRLNRNTKSEDGKFANDGYSTVLSEIIKRDFGLDTKCGSGSRVGTKLTSIYMECKEHSSGFTMKINTKLLIPGEDLMFAISRSRLCS